MRLDNRINVLKITYFFHNLLNKLCDSTLIKVYKNFMF